MPHRNWKFGVSPSRCFRDAFNNIKQQQPSDCKPSILNVHTTPWPSYLSGQLNELSHSGALEAQAHRWRRARCSVGGTSCGERRFVRSCLFWLVRLDSIAGICVCSFDAGNFVYLLSTKIGINKVYLLKIW